MADQIEEVKQKSDIVGIIGGYINLKKAGRNYKALCPFHGEKTPSFMVSQELQIYKCFGCGETGDVFTFLEKYEGMEFGEALKYLADKAGIKLKPLNPRQSGEKDRLLEINRLAGKFYQYVLLNHRAGRQALNYLTRQRGLKIDTVKKFQLGFSPTTPEALTNFLIKRKKYPAAELITAGLIYRGRGGLVDRFFGRVIFPLFDHRGNIIGFAGRLLPQDENKEVGKYINSPETPLYHKSRVLYGLNITRSSIKQSKTAVVVEGELDLISSWQAGIPNIVAIKGSALTTDQVNLISRFAEKLVLALDSDFAGESAARKGVAEAFGSGLEIKVADLGEYKDPDEMARKNPEGLKRSLVSAVGIWDFFIKVVFAKHNAETGEGSSKVSREIVPILSSIPDKIVQAHYIDVVAKKLGVPTGAVEEEVLKTKPGLVNKIEKPDSLMPETKSRRQLLEERLIVLFFHHQPEVLLEKKHWDLIQESLNLRIIEQLKNYLKVNGDYETSKFAEGLPKELYDGFSQIILTDSPALPEEPEKFDREINLLEREIKIVDLKAEVNKLTAKITELEKHQQKEDLEKTKKRFSQLLNKLNELEENADQGIIL